MSPGSQEGKKEREGKDEREEARIALNEYIH